MALFQLTVLNRKVGAAPSAPLLPDAFTLGTCLREVRIAMLRLTEQPSRAAAEAAGYERYTGAAAYEFLLRLASGLESEIAGETEIFGQIKQAWRAFEAADMKKTVALRPWMQRLLQDTKEIRSEYVVGLGSATYGSLVRRLLNNDLPGPTLLIGAGQLAETILPFLDHGEVMVWNRGRERAEAMLARQRGAGRVHLLDSGAAAERAAWQRAHDVILCIPADAARDAERIGWWQARPSTGGRILHLGIDGAAGSAWEGVPGLSTLRDLFELRDNQASQRELALARARRACRDKAQLARLDDADGSRAGSSNHGWEDLGVFESFTL